MIADPTLQINPQVTAVLAVLSTCERPKGIRCETAAWYNGRERGAVISCQRNFSGPVLHLVIVEARSSDRICVQSWSAACVQMNPPTIRDWPESAYQNQRYFKVHDVKSVVEEVQGQIERFAENV